MKETFIEALAKPQPIPGGGAAAAYGATLALALVQKIVALELQRSRDLSDQHSHWQDLLNRLAQVVETLDRLRDEDGRAYLRMAEIKAGSGSAEACQTALAYATQCPMRIMQAACDGLSCAGAAGKHCKPHLLADLLVACELLQAALAGASHIAAANVKLMLTETVAQRHQHVLRASLEQGKKSFENAKNIIFSRMA